jgi:site-specific DNA-methyltransferase (adenine-specific)
MERVPNDLNDIQIRNEYLNEHKNWFLKYHPNAVMSFEIEVEKKYGKKSSIQTNEPELFDDSG